MTSKRKIIYSIYSPGGNDTALVHKLVSDGQLRKKINSKIMEKYKNVEQVGFVGLHNKTIELIMAGGEFCANATRCATFMCLQGKYGTKQIRVSGTSKLLNAGIDKNRNVWAEMPINSDPKNIRILDNFSLVDMDGISHVVIRQSNILQKQQTILKGKKILEKLGLLQSSKAAGVMFVRKVEGLLFIYPVVWVRDIQTLFYETACGSGSTAVAMLRAYEKQSSVREKIFQPSGGFIEVEVDFKKNKFLSAMIIGPVKLILENEILEIG